MKSYVVGGAVRDRLLGLPVSDRDHVVVGATVDEMIAAGFRPVGRDFPVFLHPTTHEEYALARTERKVAPGYAGFVFHADPTVTLEADLERRDLTINAMAEDEADGHLFDPFEGRQDLERRVFRHVGPAFVEDPVRVLRVARFAARFTDFTVAPETMLLMRGMAGAGEIDALVPERVWQELARGLMERRPSRMLAVLLEAEAWPRLFPGAGDLLQGDAADRTKATLDRAATADASLDVRFALLLDNLTADAETALGALAQRLAVPRAARELASLVLRLRGPLRRAVAEPSTDADAFVAAMERADAFRRRPRFEQVLEAIGLGIVDEAGRSSFRRRAIEASSAAQSIDASATARAVDYDPRRIGAALHAARVTAVAAGGLLL